MFKLTTTEINAAIAGHDSVIIEKAEQLYFQDRRVQYSRAIALDAWSSLSEAICQKLHKEVVLYLAGQVVRITDTFYLDAVEATAGNIQPKLQRQLASIMSSEVELSTEHHEVMFALQQLKLATMKYGFALDLLTQPTA